MRRSMRRQRMTLLSSFLLCAAGCPGTNLPFVYSQNKPDAGTPDGGLDAGSDDGGPTDAGPADGGPVDAGGPTQRPWPTLPGSAAMPTVSIVTIVASNDDDQGNLFLFSDTLVTSFWWSTLAQAYGSDPNPTSAHLVGPPITADMAEGDQSSYIAAVIGDAGGVDPNGSRVYLLYLPAGANFSDATNCGHHSHYPDLATSIGDQWAAVRQCAYQDKTIFNYQTTVASHEIAEAVTDSPANGYRFPLPPALPWQGSVWQSVQPPRVETGDLCEGTQTTEGVSPPFTYQRIWLNSAAAAGGDPCIPASGVPYFNLSVPDDWYAVSPGQVLQIHFTGWSTAARADWFVSPHYVYGIMGLADGDFTMQTDLHPDDIGCGAEVALNNGVNGSLQITVPDTVEAGDWAVFSLHSYDTSPATCWPPGDEDSNHWWPVGIYVP